MNDGNDWKRKGSGDSRGLQNRRSLSLMAMVGSTPTRFRQFSSRLACLPCRFSRPSQYRRSEGTFVLAKRRFLSYVMTPSPPSPRIIMRFSSIRATAKTEWGGHRVQAMKHIDAALDELEEAERWAREHHDIK